MNAKKVCFKTIKEKSDNRLKKWREEGNKTNIQAPDATNHAQMEHKAAMCDELLEALINLRKCISETRGKDATEELIAADAAIAKAKGEM